MATSAFYLKIWKSNYLRLKECYFFKPIGCLRILRISSFITDVQEIEEFENSQSRLVVNGFKLFFPFFVLLSKQHKLHIFLSQL